MQCRDFHHLADSYLGNELLVETNHDVLRHLEACASCRRELAARRALRATLRTAFANSAELLPPAGFAERVRAQLRAGALNGATRPGVRWAPWAALAASVLLMVTFGWLAWGSSSNTSPERAGQGNNPGHANGSDVPRPGPPGGGRRAVNVVMMELTRLAAGDHRDCAIAYHLTEFPIPLDEAGRQYDRAYIDLTSAVMSHQNQFTGEIKLVKAHSCIFEGQRFGHVVLRHGHRIVSVLVTELDEAQEGAEPAPGQTPSGAFELVAGAPLEGYQISYCSTARHGIFIVSDLTEAENLNLARALAPAVYAHVARREPTA